MHFSTVHGFSATFHAFTVRRRAIKSKRGIGLLEILIVISIIAILAVLVVPVLRSAMESADSARCLSNLRQIGVAAHLYGGEHNGRIVPTRWPEDATADAIYWFAALAPYLGGKDAMAIYRCPTSLKVHKIINGGGHTYSLNCYICPYYPIEPDSKLRRFVEFATPGKIILAAHGAWLKGGSLYASNMTFGAQSPEPIHKGKSNILFLDGHAETLPPSTYLQHKYWRL